MTDENTYHFGRGTLARLYDRGYNLSVIRRMADDVVARLSRAGYPTRAEEDETITLPTIGSDGKDKTMHPPKIITTAPEAAFVLATIGAEAMIEI